MQFESYCGLVSWHRCLKGIWYLQLQSLSVYTVALLSAVFLPNLLLAQTGLHFLTPSPSCEGAWSQYLHPAYITQPVPHPIHTLNLKPQYGGSMCLQKPVSGYKTTWCHTRKTTV
jgi:hypothetical protein